MSGEAPESGPGQPPTDPPASVQVPDPSIHVFISYASQDAAIANTVVGALERAGLRCWIAPRDVVPGALYADEIVRAINESKVVILILSEQAVASSHVGKEIERASSKRRRIIALRTASVTLTRAFEYFLSESQWIDVGAGRIEAKLVDAVRRHLTPDSAIEPSIPREGLTYGHKSATSRGRWLVIALVAVAAVAVAYFVVERFSRAKHLMTNQAATQNVISDKSVAVLPFTDMSEKKDQEYFADGMAEEIIDLLVNVPELKVPARTSSFYFKGKSITIPEIARELGVAHILEGSVRKSGSHLRVTTQLVSADNGYHLWSETYDRQLEDVFKTQDEIAGAVVAALKLKLAPGQQATSSHRTSNPDAYNQYLLGRQFFEGFTLDGFRRAVDAYRQAIQLDPNYAAAYAELAISEFFVADQTDDTAQKQQALVTADKAVALAPDEADGYADRGYLRYEFAWDWTGAQSDFAKALALNPGDNRFQRRYAQLLGALAGYPRALRC